MIRSQHHLTKVVGLTYTVISCYSVIHQVRLHTFLKIFLFVLSFKKKKKKLKRRYGMLLRFTLWWNGSLAVNDGLFRGAIN